MPAAPVNDIVLNAKTFRVGATTRDLRVLTKSQILGSVHAVYDPSKSWTSPSVRLANSDVRSAGNGFIQGSVKVKTLGGDTPVSRPVRLYRNDTGEFVWKTMSYPDGSYRFDNLDVDKRFFVVAFDSTGLYRAVIADNLKPETSP